MVIQFAISRQNEFQADRTAAELTGQDFAIVREASMVPEIEATFEAYCHLEKATWEASDPDDAVPLGTALGSSGCTTTGSSGLVDPSLAVQESYGGPAGLKKLVDAGLVSVERRHKWAYYSISPTALKELTTWLS